MMASRPKYYNNEYISVMDTKTDCGYGVQEMQEATMELQY